MRSRVVDGAVRAAMAALVPLMLSACGSHDASNNASSTDKAASSETDDTSNNSQLINSELSDNEMDSNAAQIDTANGTADMGKPAGAGAQ